MKYFQEKRPGLYVLSAGSLLGLSLAKPRSYPVGKVEFLDIEPMTFKEFLMADSETVGLANFLNECSEIKQIPDIIFDAVPAERSSTQTKNKLRNVEYSEDSLRSSIQTLYDTILEQKAAYDSAATAMQSAQLTWNAAQLQWQNGSLSQLGYLQQELAYLQAQSGFTCADLALQQAMQNYDWAVKGVTVSAE